MEDVGRRLREARETRGITLETAEAETKIRKKYLEALERGREVDIPGEVYLKGFLRTYGNYLGMDGPALVDEYKQAQEARRPTADPSDPHRPAERPRPAESRAAEREVAVSVSPRPVGVARAAPAVGRPAWMALVVVAAIAAVGYVGWLIALQLGSTVEPPPAADAGTQTPPPPPAESKPVEAPPPRLPDPPPPAPEPKVSMIRGTGDDVMFTVPARSFTVRLEMEQQRVWMEATVDGQVRYSGTPTAPVEFTGSDMRIRVGHMNGVSLVVNGQRFDQPLKNGPYWLIFKSE